MSQSHKKALGGEEAGDWVECLSHQFKADQFHIVFMCEFIVSILSETEAISWLNCHRSWAAQRPAGFFAMWGKVRRRLTLLRL